MLTSCALNRIGTVYQLWRAGHAYVLHDRIVEGSVQTASCIGMDPFNLGWQMNQPTGKHGILCSRVLARTDN